jgi:hypothetical protein
MPTSSHSRQATVRSLGLMQEWVGRCHFANGSNGSKADAQPCVAWCKNLATKTPRPTENIITRGITIPKANAFYDLCTR